MGFIDFKAINFCFILFLLYFGKNQNRPSLKKILEAGGLIVQLLFSNFPNLDYSVWLNVKIVSKSETTNR